MAAFGDSASLIDDFNRTNEGPPLSSSWTQSGRVSYGFQVVTNEGQAETVSNTCEEYYNVRDYGPDVEAHYTIGQVSSTTFSSVAVRMADEDTANVDCYYAQQRGTTGLQLWRLDNDTDTALGSIQTQTIATGDKIGISAIGTTITGYFDDGGAGWAPFDSTMDSTYSSAGPVGQATFLNGGAATQFTFDNWYAGTVPEGPGIRVLQTKAAQGSSTDTVNVVLDNSVREDSILMVTWNGYAGTSATVVVSDNNSNSYTEVFDQTYNSNVNFAGIAYAAGVNGGPTTVTVVCSQSGSYFKVVVTEVSGIVATSPVDQSNSNTGSSTAWDSGNITTTQGYEFLFGMMGQDGGSYTLTEDSAWYLLYEEEDWSANTPISVGCRIVNTTLTESYSGTIGTSTGWYSATASFKAAAPANDTIIDVVQVACNTSTGTQTITGSLGGKTPKAAIFQLTNNTSNGTSAANITQMFGATDGVNEFCYAHNAADNLADSSASNSYETGRCVNVYLYDNTVDGYAVFDSFTTNGVVISWTDAPSSAYLLTVTLIAGDDVSAYVGIEINLADVASTPVDVSTVGFQPEVVIVAGDDSGFPNSGGGNADLKIGLVHFDGVTLTQRAWYRRVRDARTTDAAHGMIRNNGVGAFGVSTSMDYYYYLEDFDPYGFSATTTPNGGNNDEFCFVALSFAGGAKAAVADYTSPSSTGSHSSTALSFEPQYVMMIGTKNTSGYNTWFNGDAEIEAVFIGQFTGTNEYCVSTSCDHGAETTEDNSITDSKAIRFLDGDNTDEHVATLSSMNSDGFTLSYTTAPAAYQWFYLAIETEVTGTNVSDNQPAYIAGSQAASDSQPAYIAGSVNVSDSQPAYIAGSVNVSDSQPAYIGGSGSVDFESGSSQYIDYGDPGTPFDGLTHMAISFWVRFESLGVNENIVSRWNYTGGGNRGWVVVYSSGSGGMRFEYYYDDGSSSDAVQETDTPLTGVDYHYVILVAPEYRRIYRDGKLQAVDVDAHTSIADNNHNLRIASQVDVSNYLDGLLAAVTIWGGDDASYLINENDIGLLAAGTDPSTIRPTKQIFRVGLTNTSDIDDAVNSLTGTASGSPTNGADITPTYPTLSGASDGSSFFDDLNASDQLSTATAGSGSASYSDDNLVLDCPGAAGDAAIGYYSTPINKDRSQTWAVTFKVSDAVTTYPIWLYDHTSAPTTGAQSTIEGRMKTRCVFASTVMRFEYWDDARGDWFWDGTNNVWSASSSTGHSPVTTDDYYIIVFETDGPGQRYRWLAYHKTQSGEHQGLYLFEMTEWVPWRLTDTIDNNLYIAFGHPFTDVAANHDVSIEHVHRSNDDIVHSWLNGQDKTYSLGEYSVFHYYCYDRSRPFFVPSSRYAILGFAQEAGRKDQMVLLDDGGTYLMYHRNVTSNNIDLATADDPYGPWTLSSSNPIITPPATHSNVHFPFLVKDLGEATNKYLLFYGSEDGSGVFHIYRQVGASSTSFSGETQILTAGSGGAWDDGGVSGPRVYRINGAWELWFAGYAGDWGSWAPGQATPDDGTLTDNDWTKYGSNPIIQGDNVYTGIATGSSGRSLEVDSTTGFVADMAIFIKDHVSGFSTTSKVRAVTDSNTLELYHSNTSPNDIWGISSIAEGGIQLAELIKIGSTWYLFATVFQTNYGGASNIVTESVALFTTTDSDPVTATWTIDRTYSPYVIMPAIDDNDFLSMENTSFVAEPSAASAASNQAAYISGAGANDIDIQGNEGHIAYDAVSGDAVRAILNAADTTDVETTLTFRFNNNPIGMGLRIFIRASRDWASLFTPTSGYEVLIEPDGDYTLNHIASGSRNLLGSGTWTGDTADHDIRFQAVGTAVKFKIWASAGAEPGAWSNEHTAIASEPAGTLQLAASYISGSSSYDIYFDDLSYHEPAGGANSRQAAYIAGTADTSDNKSAYMAGALDVADNKAAYIAGSLDVSDSQSAYIAGSLDVSDSQSAYIAGSLDVSDSQSAYIAGGLDVVDNQPAYIAGGVNVSDNQPAYVAGSATSSDNQPAYIVGVAGATSNQIAYIAGTDTASDNAPAYIAGSLDVSDNKSAYIVGVAGAVDNKSAYIAGQATGTDNIPAYIAGTADATDNIQAYIAGSIDTSDSAAAYIAGTADATDNIPAYIAGGLNVSDSSAAYIAGTATASSNKAAYIEGTSSDEVSNIPAYIHGQDTTADNQPAYIAGGVNVASSQIAYIQGQDTTSDNVPAYIQGQLSASARTPAYIAGQASDASRQAAYIAGVDTTSDSKSAYIAGLTYFPFTEDFSTGNDGDSWRISHWVTGSG